MLIHNSLNVLMNPCSLKVSNKNEALIKLHWLKKIPDEPLIGNSFTMIHVS